MKSWKTVSSKRILSHPRLSVFEDTVELPNGHTTTYIHFGEAKDAVTAIVIRKDGKVLIQKEFSYPSGEWLYQFPGGGLRKDETAIEGIRREVAEEAKLTGEFRELGWFYPDNRRKKDRMHVFLVTKLEQSEAEQDQEEVFIDYWLDPQAVKKLIREGQIVNYSTLAAWAIYTAAV